MPPGVHNLEYFPELLGNSSKVSENSLIKKKISWITGNQLKRQVNQSNFKKSYEPPRVNNEHNCPQSITQATKQATKQAYIKQERL